MDAQRWQRVEALFAGALACPAGERAAFLEKHCPDDPSLRAEVEQLLASDATATRRDFLVPAPLNVKAQLPAADPFLGRRLGAYEVRKLLGRGGMGNVYLAVRVADFKQRVALKLLKRGLDTDEILRRFRTEIQVLAALGKHPNIAGLLDAGTTEEGLPYFVMEYVEGERLDHYSDHRRLSTRERLQLFCAVCAAVQFAHQHAIIHRDLKMSNVLVTVDGVPKLIDFGIAKLTVPELGPQTATPTRTVARFLTPEYASPEQVRGESVTTASDVYSLGVVLYELLTGHRPYRLAGRGIHEIERAVGEEEPETPSSVIARRVTVPTADGGTHELTPETVSRVRNESPQKLRRALAGDLDNVVLTALRKEPQRRYATAELLAADVRRHLEGLPVEARPLGRLERLWRGCRRHPVPVSLILAVLLGSAFGLWHLSRLSSHLVRSTALESAAQQAEVLEQVQDFYSEVVVRRVGNKAPVSHLYASQQGAIPIPATFTIDLSQAISANSPSGMRARLYSDHPFRSRADGGPRDDFEREALVQLRRNPEEPYYRFEDYLDRPSLRYAVARRMQPTCIDCHNKHPDSTKRDWQVGDVRGVLEIIRPLDRDMARTSEGLHESFVYMALIALALLGVSVSVLVFRKK